MMGKLKGALLRGRKSHGNLRDQDAQPRPSSPLDFQCGGVDWMDTDPFARRPDLNLEALDLGPLTSRSLRPMAPLVVTPQQIVASAPPSRKHSMADSMRDALNISVPVRKASLGDMSYGLLSSPLPQLQTPTEERSNPFDDEPVEFRVTPLPRADRERRTHSYRGRRELPLRVQAIRRSHQNAFAEALARSLEAEMVAQDEVRAPVAYTPSRIVAERPNARQQWAGSGGQPYISLRWPELAPMPRESVFAADYSLNPSPESQSPPRASSREEFHDPLLPFEDEIPIILPPRRGIPF